MSKKSSTKKRVYPIAGETVHERKRAVQKLLASLGYTVGLGRILQEKGVIAVRWEPPFSDQLLEKMTRLAQYAAVFFVPEGKEAKLASIDVIFEREPGLFMDYPVMKRSILLGSLQVLHEELARYAQLACKHEAVVEEIMRNIEATPEPEPEQQGLWE